MGVMLLFTPGVLKDEHITNYKFDLLLQCQYFFFQEVKTESPQTKMAADLSESRLV